MGFASNFRAKLLIFMKAACATVLPCCGRRDAGIVVPPYPWRALEAPDMKTKLLMIAATVLATSLVSIAPAMADRDHGGGFGGGGDGGGWHGGGGYGGDGGGWHDGDGGWRGGDGGGYRGGFGFGIFAPPIFVAPPPVYYAPPPVYYAPPPEYYAPPPPVYYAPPPPPYGPPGY
jgi:hypothetical protein